MKKLNFTFLAAGALLWGLGACSSSNPDTTTTTTTTEQVSTDRDATRATGSEMDTGTGPGKGVWSSTTNTGDTISFHALAASNNILEVLAGTQARGRAMNPEVKRFAEQMITEHTKTSEELSGLAGRKNLGIPTQPLPAHQRMLDKLTNEKDADEFDEEYMDMQVVAHKQAVELYESAAKNQSDADVRAWASSKLPSLRMHLQEAKRIKDLVK